MRYVIFRRGGYALDAIGTTGGETSGAVFLFRDPVGDLEAATKNYADSSVNNINAGAFSTGVLRHSVLPAFTGDITKEEKKNVITLTPTGVAAGVYTKVSVDLKGRVTAGGGLVESDMPSIPYSKVTTNRPTTLEGYGILDAMSHLGGTLTGKLTLQVVGNTPYSILNKDYVDTFFENTDSGVVTGSVVLKTTQGPYSDYLLCNGALVSRAEYGNLYSSVGERYAQFVHPGNGKPWSSQFNINLEEGAAFGNFVTGGALPESLGNSKLAVTKDRVYLMGGRNGTTVVNTTRTAAINSDGTLGTWSTGTALTRPRHSGEVVVTKNRVFYIGGAETSADIPTNTVYSSAIGTTGVTTAWSAATALPIALSDTQVLVIRNKMWVIGGRSTSGGVSSIYSSPINASDGTTGAWTLEGNLPEFLYNHSATVIGDWVYVIGGINSQGVSSKLLKAPINSLGDIGSWTHVSLNDLPTPMSRFEVLVTRHNLKIIGRHQASSKPNSVLTAKINLDGSLGVWTYGVEVPSGVLNSAFGLVKGKAYFFGGTGTGTTTVDSSYVSDIVGGKSDYSKEYDTNYTSVLTDRTVFQLPQLESEIPGTYCFVKI